MNLNDLRLEVEKDVYIDKNDISKTAINVPILHNKYLRILSDSQMRLLKTKSSYDTLYKQKYLYYRNDFEVILKNKAEIEIMLDGDEELQSSFVKLEYERAIINYLESVLKQIGTLGFLIRDVIAWEKFKNGEF